MKIIIAGKGGQGMKFLGKALAELLMRKGYEVAFTFDFDAAVRGGDSIAYITYSKEKIENPIIDEADILVELSETAKKFEAKKTMNGIEGKPENMHALGILLKELKLEVTDEELNEILPERNREENLKIVREELQKA